MKGSSTVVQSAEFIQCAVDDVDQNLSSLDALIHSMKWVILQTFYRVGPHSEESYSKLWKWMSTCWPHLDPQFLYIFCGVRLTETRNTEVQYCIDPTASDLEWKVSFPHHSWSLKKQAVHGVHIQASVLSILCHDIHWSWRNTELCDTAEHCSTMFIFVYNHPLWWKSIIIIKNKPETSNLQGIVLKLGGFHTLVSLLEAVDHIMAGWSLWSLLALRLKTQWLKF